MEETERESKKNMELEDQLSELKKQSEALAQKLESFDSEKEELNVRFISFGYVRGLKEKLAEKDNFISQINQAFEVRIYSM